MTLTVEHYAHGELYTVKYINLMRPWTVNAERAGNRWKRAENTKLWRTLYAEQGSIPQLTDATIWVWLELRGRLQDTAACMPAVKAAIDGMVDAKVFSDDTGEHVKAIIFNAPSRSKTDQITILVEGKLNE